MVIDDATSGNPCAGRDVTVITRRDLARYGSAKVFFDNDTSPCVLSDGRIVTHWLSAPVPHGDALKVMKPNGESFDVIPLGESIVRGSVTCSG